MRALRWLPLVVLMAAAVAAGTAGQLGAEAAPATPGEPQTGRLQADRIRYDARARVFMAEGHVRLTVGEVEIRAGRLRLDQRAQVATAQGQVVVQQPGARLAAEGIRYEIRSRTAEAEGHVVLVQGDMVLRAGRVRFALETRVTQASAGVTVTQKDLEVRAPVLTHDGRTDQVTAEGGVRLSQAGSILTGARLAANLRTTRAEMSGGARLVRPGTPQAAAQPPVDALAREETTITAEQMRFRWDVPEAEARGDVRVRQRDRAARAARGWYSEAQGRLLLEGDVVVEGLTGDLLLPEGERPASEEARQVLAAPARLACQRLTLFLQSRDMEAEGEVKLTQGARLATGDSARYTHRDRRVTVSGNVYLQDEDGNSIRADQVIIALREETFEALGNVRTEFKVRRTK
ncbi:MAG: LptA/OstA family protein [Armatimonadota bacterium]|nr:LptA/OstA family protein [Armatimonadota bacterium]MDR7468766.1 LptA/OstA family protein [Armatimonadota bacterium]